MILGGQIASANSGGSSAGLRLEEGSASVFGALLHGGSGITAAYGVLGTGSNGVQILSLIHI